MADTGKKVNNNNASHDDVAAKRRKTQESETKPASAVAAGGPSVSNPLSTTPPPILNLLFKTSVASLMPNTEKALYTCHRDESLSSCFKGLVEHQVTSCPVLTKGKKPKFFNFLEIWDVVEFVVKHFQSHGSLASSKNFWELIRQEEAFNALVVNDVTKFPTSRTRFDSLPLPMEYSLLLACELMMREKNLHRLAVVESVATRDPKNVITQSRIVQFICENMDALADRKHRTVGEFPGVLCNVLTVPFDTKAIDAFTTMAKEGFTGLPVVDKDGKLCALISMSDIKGMALDGSLFFRLYNTVWEFLQKMRNDYPNQHSDHPICCKKTDNLESVIRTLVTHKLHRLPIVTSDADKKVIGIITLRDVLRACLLPW